MAQLQPQQDLHRRCVACVSKLSENALKRQLEHEEHAARALAHIKAAQGSLLSVLIAQAQSKGKEAHLCDRLTFKFRGGACPFCPAVNLSEPQYNAHISAAYFNVTLPPTSTDPGELGPLCGKNGVKRPDTGDRRPLAADLLAAAQGALAVTPQHLHPLLHQAGPLAAQLEGVAAPPFGVGVGTGAAAAAGAAGAATPAAAGLGLRGPAAAGAAVQQQAGMPVGGQVLPAAPPAPQGLVSALGPAPALPAGAAQAAAGAWAAPAGSGGPAAAEGSATSGLAAREPGDGSEVLDTETGEPGPMEGRADGSSSSPVHGFANPAAGVSGSPGQGGSREGNAGAGGTGPTAANAGSKRPRTTVDVGGARRDAAGDSPGRSEPDGDATASPGPGGSGQGSAGARGTEPGAPSTVQLWQPETYAPGVYTQCRLPDGPAESEDPNSGIPPWPLIWRREGAGPWRPYRWKQLTGGNDGCDRRFTVRLWTLAPGGPRCPGAHAGDFELTLEPSLPPEPRDGLKPPLPVRAPGGTTLSVVSTSHAHLLPVGKYLIEPLWPHDRPPALQGQALTGCLVQMQLADAALALARSAAAAMAALACRRLRPVVAGAVTAAAAVAVEAGAWLGGRILARAAAATAGASATDRGEAQVLLPAGGADWSLLPLAALQQRPASGPLGTILEEEEEERQHAADSDQFAGSGDQAVVGSSGDEGEETEEQEAQDVSAERAAREEAQDRAVASQHADDDATRAARAGASSEPPAVGKAEAIDELGAGVDGPPSPSRAPSREAPTSTRGPQLQVLRPVGPGEETSGAGASRPGPHAQVGLKAVAAREADAGEGVSEEQPPVPQPKLPAPGPLCTGPPPPPLPPLPPETLEPGEPQPGTPGRRSAGAETPAASGQMDVQNLREITRLYVRLGGSLAEAVAEAEVRKLQALVATLLLEDDRGRLSSEAMALAQGPLSDLQRCLETLSGQPQSALVQFLLKDALLPPVKAALEGAASASRKLASVWAPPGLVSEALAGELKCMAAWRPQLEALEEVGQPAAALREQVAQLHGAELEGELRRVVVGALAAAGLGAVVSSTADPNKDLEELKAQVSKLEADGDEAEAGYLRPVYGVLDPQLGFEVEWSALGEPTFVWQLGDADIYHATYQGEEVALKRLKHDRPGDLRREFLRIRSLPLHKRVVGLVGITTDPSTRQPGLVMEWHPLDLHRVLVSASEKKRQLTLGMKLRIALDLAEGVQYLHANKMVHRNVIPDTVLLSDGLEVTIADFSHSRTVDEDGKVHGDDGYGFQLWMAPELPPHGGAQVVYSQAVDVYGWGVIFCQLITRKHDKLYELLHPELINLDPSLGTWYEQLYGLHREPDGLRQLPALLLDRLPPHLEPMPPALSEAVLGLARDCLRLEPGERPGMGEVVERVRALLRELAADRSAASAEQPQ
ncbi:hypothetical protein HYH03_012270 [Edaphochlamys debaryana]|uniref:Protein kinase domain-containing protein n=1 Tax=Edaphochlamys debaryana TaxID=47281 RepID=A0A836BUB9_9CHLO|nr:hypothetical protein HYH03_012270 [Edaphochlamys debaryana]|eukprot:KAG2489250.1 hypothetical protein HYH03_012270 [Edaphochlamys debaryana]